MKIIAIISGPALQKITILYMSSPTYNYLGRTTFKCPIDGCSWEGQTRSGRSKHIRRQHGPVRQDGDEGVAGSSRSSLPAAPVGHLSVRVLDPQSGSLYRGVIHRAPRDESTRLGEPEGETLSDSSQRSESDNPLDPDWVPGQNI